MNKKPSMHLNYEYKHTRQFFSVSGFLILILELASPGAVEGLLLLLLLLPLY